MFLIFIQQKDQDFDVGIPMNERSLKIEGLKCQIKSLFSKYLFNLLLKLVFIRIQYEIDAKTYFPISPLTLT